VDVPAYCRDIETYLCRKNDGHLIRVVGPSFELVSRWAEHGVPLKVAFAGIDRYFDRYYSKGPRRRPVKIDFCEADVLDVYDEWRRATGISTGDRSDRPQPADGRPGGVGVRPDAASHQSLPAHLQRVVARLTSARANGTIGDAFDALIDRISAELDAARAKAGGLRGDTRQALVARLRDLDSAALGQARALLDDATRAALAREADVELAPFRSGMTDAAFVKAREAAIDRLVRERFNLPTITFTA
jgi:hypothetical protein